MSRSHTSVSGPGSEDEPTSPSSPPAGGPGLPAYAAAVASGAPTPGGGSVVAVVAALAAALGEMVRHLSLGRAADEDAERELTAAADRLGALRRALLRLAAADEAAYDDYRTAAALPKGTEPERAARVAALQAALVAATDVPLAVATACAELIERLHPIARLGTRHALSDAEAGAILAEAALRAALFNVRGNARLLIDAPLAARYLAQADDLETAGRRAADRVLATARARTPT